MTIKAKIIRSSLPQRAKVLLLHLLARGARRKAGCTAPTDKLARELRFSRRTIQRHLKHCEAAGHLRIERSGSGSGKSGYKCAMFINL